MQAKELRGWMHSFVYEPFWWLVHMDVVLHMRWGCTAHRDTIPIAKVDALFRV